MSAENAETRGAGGHEEGPSSIDSDPSDPDDTPPDSNSSYTADMDAAWFSSLRIERRDIIYRWINIVGRKNDSKKNETMGRSLYIGWYAVRRCGAPTATLTPNPNP